MAETIPQHRRRTVPSKAEKPAIAAVEVPPAPVHLSAESRQLWQGIVAEWVLAVDALLILRGALESWDSYQAHRAAAEKQPTFETGTGQVKANPRARMALDALREFRLSLRALGLAPPGA
ncbi:hypothetical protein BH23GEM2_BH23GEM2_14880 [soil metagenome]